MRFDGSASQHEVSSPLQPKSVWTYGKWIRGARRMPAAQPWPLLRGPSRAESPCGNKFLQDQTRLATLEQCLSGERS